LASTSSLGNILLIVAKHNEGHSRWVLASSIHIYNEISQPHQVISNYVARLPAPVRNQQHPSEHPQPQQSQDAYSPPRSPVESPEVLIGVIGFYYSTGILARCREEENKREEVYVVQHTGCSARTGLASAVIASAGWICCSTICSEGILRLKKWLSVKGAKHRDSINLPYRFLGDAGISWLCCLVWGKWKVVSLGGILALGSWLLAPFIWREGNKVRTQLAACSFTPLRGSR
jgi:hypothetical protein